MHSESLERLLMRMAVIVEKTLRWIGWSFPDKRLYNNNDLMSQQNQIWSRHVPTTEVNADAFEDAKGVIRSRESKFQTIQWSNEGQTIQWSNEGQTIQWSKDNGKRTNNDRRQNTTKYHTKIQRSGNASLTKKWYVNSGATDVNTHHIITYTKV